MLVIFYLFNLTYKLFSDEDIVYSLNLLKICKKFKNIDLFKIVKCILKRVSERDT